MVIIIESMKKEYNITINYHINNPVCRLPIMAIHCNMATKYLNNVIKISIKICGFFSSTM